MSCTRTGVLTGDRRRSISRTNGGFSSPSSVKLVVVRVAGGDEEERSLCRLMRRARAGQAHARMAASLAPPRAGPPVNRRGSSGAHRQASSAGAVASCSLPIIQLGAPRQPLARRRHLRGNGQRSPASPTCGWPLDNKPEGAYVLLQRGEERGGSLRPDVCRLEILLILRPSDAATATILVLQAIRYMLLLTF